VAVDLLSAGWPCYELPYLTSIHASAILSATHVAGVPQPLWDRIRDAGDGQRSRCSDRVSISPHYSITRWWRGTVVERRSLTGELYLSCARPAADG